MKKPLWELSNHECRYPLEYDTNVIGHFWFCAEPIRDRETSYCAKHAKPTRDKPNPHYRRNAAYSE